ncbi:MAG: hypothetical protein L6437_16245 [Kiritimatiellae bacterium]|nr:hypothetical protein [Kiritimatiellia bacterium]
MKTLNLPKFNIPELPRKHLTPKAYQAWVSDNLKRLRANGQLARLLIQPERRPTDKRFVLPYPKNQ